MADEAKQASGSGQQDAVSDKTQHLLGTATGNLSSCRRDSPVDCHRHKNAPRFLSRLLVFALPIFAARATILCR